MTESRLESAKILLFQKHVTLWKESVCKL